MNQDAKRKLMPIVPVVSLVVVIAVVVAGAKIFGGDDSSNKDTPTFDVKRGSLTISIDASGTIKALDQEVIKCMVEGITTILTLIPEGTRVKKGDLLVELDSSDFRDLRVTQQIIVKNAETTLLSTKENLAVGKNQAEADLELAMLTLDFAKQDLEKYEKGDYQNELTDANAQIKVKEEAQTQAEDNFGWSEKLFAEKYISETELKRDELALSRARLDLKLAESRLQLLEEFTYKRTMKQLTSDVKQAEMALERTKRKATADVVLLEAALLAAESVLSQETDILKKLDRNIVNTMIYAPSDGMVVYASTQSGRFGSSREPLEEGQQAHERQELIHLPTSDKVKAEVKVHESSMEMVDVNLPVIISVDAVPDKTFTGRVAKIAMLPDAQMVWLNPDLKVYTTEIHLDGDGNELRTGMSCRASIVVEQYEDVVYIPVQAVVRVGDQPTVYVLKDKRTEPRKVEIGLDNNRMVNIISGLEVGEKVVLAPPLAPAEARDSKMRDALRRINEATPEDLGQGEQGPGIGGGQRPGMDRGGAGRRPGPGAGQRPEGGGPPGMGAGQRPEGARPPGMGAGQKPEGGGSSD